MNHYDVMVMGLRPATAGRWSSGLRPSLIEMPHVAKIRCHHHRDRPGRSLAARFADAGMSVAIIERHNFGGTCVNTGCIPTKTLVASAYAAHVARRGAEYGFAINGDVRVDMKTC
jgi:hypothetical protein